MGHGRNHEELKRAEKLATRPECRVYPRKEPVYSRLSSLGHAFSAFHAALFSRTPGRSLARRRKSQRRRERNTGEANIVPDNLFLARETSPRSSFIATPIRTRRSNLSFDSTLTRTSCSFGNFPPLRRFLKETAARNRRANSEGKRLKRRKKLREKRRYELPTDGLPKLLRLVESLFLFFFLFFSFNFMASFRSIRLLQRFLSFLLMLHVQYFIDLLYLCPYLRKLLDTRTTKSGQN